MRLSRFRGSFFAAGIAALSCMASAQGAAAQSTPGFLAGEKQAAAAVVKMESACPKRRGTAPVKRGEGWRTSHSIVQDDWVFVVNGEKLDCLTAAMCGTGGCALHIIAVIADKPRIVFDQAARGWEFSHRCWQFQ